jgi:protein-disulfide isomerase
VTVHEFIDYRCPHCKVASAQTLQKLARSSNTRIVRRHQPRMTCDVAGSCESVRLALCAAKQGKFWQADRYLFEVADLRQSLNVARASQELGLNGAELTACFEAPGTWAEAKAEAKAARKLKILATPGYIVDGKRLTHDQVMSIFF